MVKALSCIVESGQNDSQQPVKNAPVCTFGSTVKTGSLTDFEHYSYLPLKFKKSRRVNIFPCPRTPCLVSTGKPRTTLRPGRTSRWLQRARRRDHPDLFPSWQLTCVMNLRCPSWSPTAQYWSLGLREWWVQLGCFPTRLILKFINPNHAECNRMQQLSKVVAFCCILLHSAVMRSNRLSCILLHWAG